MYRKNDNSDVSIALTDMSEQHIRTSNNFSATLGRDHLPLIQSAGHNVCIFIYICLCEFLLFFCCCLSACIFVQTYIFTCFAISPCNLTIHLPSYYRCHPTCRPRLHPHPPPTHFSFRNAGTTWSR